MTMVNEKKLGEAYLLHKEGSYKSAQKLYEEYLDENPYDADGLHFLGVLKHQIGQYTEAIELIKKALTLNKAAVYYNNIVDPYLALGKAKEAEKAARKAIGISKKNSSPYNQLGLSLKYQGKTQQAIVAFRKAISLNPEDANAQNNLGNLLTKTENFHKAKDHYDKAIIINPEFVNAQTNLGLWYHENEEFDHAIRSYKRALMIKNDDINSHMNLSLTFLLRGQFAEGWKEYEWRKKLNPQTHNRFSEPSWDGTPLYNETLLVYAEQGLGDTIQFSRYLEKIDKGKGKIIFECQKPLTSLLKNIKGPDQIVAEGDDLPDFDLQVSLLSLPKIFETDLDTVPAINNSFYTAGKTPSLPNNEPSGHKKIGLVWSGNSKHFNDHNRSVALKEFDKLFKLDKTCFYTLQIDLSDKDQKYIKKNDVIHPCDHLINDFTDTATLMSQLDVVISVDTSTAHLAGSLDIPCWLLLPKVPDWRWLMERRDTPWYPSMKLYRQTEKGCWNSVIEQIEQDLKDL